MDENNIPELEVTNKIYDHYLEDKLFHYVEFAKREKKDIEVFRAHVIALLNVLRFGFEEVFLASGRWKGVRNSKNCLR